MNILLVEDNHLFGEFIGASIEGIVAVETLREAKEYLRENRVDLILLDLGLPDSDGIATIKGLADVKVPKIILTGRSDLIKEAAKHKILDFIYKGSPADIVERIQFNVNKIKSKRVRFPDHVFEQLKVYVSPCFEVEELTIAR